MLNIFELIIQSGMFYNQSAETSRFKWSLTDKMVSIFLANALTIIPDPILRILIL